MFKVENRRLRDNVKLVGTFSFLGGYTAVLSLTILGTLVNCMSGNMTLGGVALEGVNYYGFARLFFVLSFFIFGSFLGTSIFDSLGHPLILFLEAVFLLLVEIDKISIIYKALIVATAMGMQNSLTTCLGRLRSTHITGTSTDIGIALARKDKRDVFIKTLIVAGFTSGGVIGVYFAHLWGIKAFILAAFIVLTILIVDVAPKFFRKDAPLALDIFQENDSPDQELAADQDNLQSFVVNSEQPGFPENISTSCKAEQNT